MRILARLKNAIALFASILVIILVVTQSAGTPAAITMSGGFSTQVSSLPQAHKISNPAAVYCTDMGYAYQIVSDGAGGQTDTCSMPDGKVCSAWDFLEGKCGQAFSYCAKQGLAERTATDGNDPFSPEYAVCVDAQGTDAGSLTTLDNLSSKLKHCGMAIETPDSSPSTPGAALPAQAASIPPPSMTGTPPASWDWRNATYNGISGDWTTPVKDQGSCGSCWAFAAVGQTEAVINLAADNPNLDEDLAEEYLVSDCSSAGNCCGGWHYAALDFIEHYGIPDDACLPYASGTCRCDNGHCTCANNRNGSCANATCSQRCSDYGSRLSTIVSYGPVSSDRTAIKQALVSYGPLSVAIDMVQGDGSFNNGVYTCTHLSDVDHAVLIVGYDDAGGYWIVKNSWGSGWNGNGFFKMGYGQCHIEDYVYYATNIRIISGYVRTGSGSGISGVVMNGLPDNPITNTDGYYSVQVKNGWSGTVSPSKTNYVFNPATLGYSNITSDQSNQDFTGTYRDPRILLVDDDDDNPDVLSYYADTLTSLGMAYDVWDMDNSAGAPDSATLSKYFIVIWFTGARVGGNTGPDTAGETTLATFLDGGGNLLISSQNYFMDRGLTNFMSSYLGVSSATSDVSHATVTGTGDVFSGLGPYTLNYPFSNLSDAINPGGSTEIAFDGDQGSAGVDKDNGVYHTVYLGFPFEALPSETVRQQVMHAFLKWCYSRYQFYLPLVAHN